ncbi:CRISPR type III-a/mtube-associated protein csm2 [Dorea sp. 5-2]|nr:CRISPR type III-a/mtube-associated protein csm2 [Dorea sp. 5-2]
MILTDDSYDILAERTIDELLQIKDKRGKEVPIVTTSKIRNLLAMTADIYNDVMHIKEEKLPADVKGRIRYLKIRFVYEAGREPGVKNLVERGRILECLDEIRDSKQQFILFSRYVEALVAFRKFKGKRDE